MKNFWKIVMLTVLCVSLLCGVTAMAEADRFQFEKTNLTVFEGNTLELSLIRQGNCAADGELTFVSGRENIATVDENGVVTGLTKGQSTITATLKTEKRTWKASVTVTVARAASIPFAAAKSDQAAGSLPAASVPTSLASASASSIATGAGADAAEGAPSLSVALTVT